MAKKDGKRVAEVFNQALTDFLNGNNENDSSNSIDSKDNNEFVLKNNGEISLSKKDILSLKKEVGKFSIETSGKLHFDKDLDDKTLKHIDRIVIHDGVIEVPKNLYPNFLLRSEIYGKIEKY